MGPQGLSPGLSAPAMPITATSVTPVDAPTNRHHGAVLPANLPRLARGGGRGGIAELEPMLLKLLERCEQRSARDFVIHPAT